MDWMRRVASGLPSLLVLAWAGAALAQGTTGETERPLFVEGQVIVGFKSNAAGAARDKVMLRHRLGVMRQLRGIDAVLARMPEQADPRVLAAKLRALGEVAFAEPNYYRYIDLTPNDPGYPGMYNLNNTGQTGGTFDADIDAPEAWDFTTGSADVIVASIDSGIDIDHADLAPNLFVNLAEANGTPGVDDDANGFIDDVNGWDFVDNDNNPDDSDPICAGHGSHTSGTLGAAGNNGLGIAGVAHRVRIVPLRAFQQSFIFCSGVDSDLIDAINYAGSIGAHISNNSWGGGPFSQATFNAIRAARHLFVAAAGNSSTNNDLSPHYPSNYALDNIVAVAATDHNDALASFSNFGVGTVDLAAPGDDITSTILNNAYGPLSGTSMATPHVAGAAILLLAQDPTLTPHELKYRLNASVDVIGTPTITGGRLNAHEALILPDSEVAVRLTPVGPTAIPPGGQFSFDVELENTSAGNLGFDFSIRLWLAQGLEITMIGPIPLNFPGGAVAGFNLTANLPGAMPLGDHRFIGRVERAANDIFDEDQIVYDVQ